MASVKQQRGGRSVVLQVPLADAQKAKSILAKKEFYDGRFMIGKTATHLFFPLNDDGRKATFPAAWEKIEKTLKPAMKREQTLKDALVGKLTPQEQDFLYSAYDVVGSIAILEIPPELAAKEKLIARTLVDMRPAITTVLKKSGIHGGEFRTQKLTYLAGKKTKEATYKEHGCTFILDVEQVYFSVRLAHERGRIMSLVQPGEDILVLFSGCAPYPIVLAKNTLAKTIVGVELNPAGHEYGLRNIARNKTKNVTLICGDAGKESRRLAAEGKRFDRIIMPLPKSAGAFLADALLCAKNGATIHFYAFAKEDEFDDLGVRLVEQCAAEGRSANVAAITTCGQHAPRVFRVCVDLHVL